MKKWLIVLAVILLLSLPVCIALLGSGYLGFFDPDISAAYVASVRITDGITSGETIEINDEETIRLITELVSSLGPAVGTANTRNGWLYSITFLDTSESEILQIAIVDDDQISRAGHIFPADTSELIACLERLFP